MAFTHLLHLSRSWNRWRCSWRRSTKTSRKCCAREESWRPNCWTSRTRLFLRSGFLLYGPCTQVCIHTCTLSCVLVSSCFSVLTRVRGLKKGPMRLVCHSGWPEGCGVWEEAEERFEEDQSPSGWCSNYAGPPEEQRTEQEGDCPTEKSSAPFSLTPSSLSEAHDLALWNRQHVQKTSFKKLVSFVLAGGVWVHARSGSEGSKKHGDWTGGLARPNGGRGQI